MKTTSILCLLCLLYVVWTEGSSISVVGFEKGKVSFQCSHRFASGNNKYFCRHHCDSSHNILATVRPGTRVSTERITMVDFGNGAFNVTLSQLQLSDSGTYWCAVERFGFDTFKTVHLTVMKATMHEVTTVIPKYSPAWTYENISTSTLQTETNLLTVSNSTDRGELNASTGAVFSAIGVVAVTLSVLALVVCVRKCRRHTKPQAQVCSCSTDAVTADEKEVDCEASEEALPVGTSGIHCSPPRLSTVADSCTALPVYENLCRPMSAARPKYSGPHNKDELNTSDRIYVQPLSCVTSDSLREGSGGTDTNETNKPTDLHNHTNDASAHPSRPHHHCTEVRSTSFWFGLDIAEAENFSQVGQSHTDSEGELN